MHEHITMELVRRVAKEGANGRLKPGESRSVTVTADPRLLVRFDGKNGLGQWRMAGG
jgi:hypothetical protein